MILITVRYALSLERRISETLWAFPDIILEEMNRESQDVTYAPDEVLVEERAFSKRIPSHPHPSAVMVDITPDRLPTPRPGTSLHQMLTTIAQRLSYRLPPNLPPDRRFLVRLSAPSVVADIKL